MNRIIFKNIIVYALRDKNEVENIRTIFFNAVGQFIIIQIFYISYIPSAVNYKVFNTVSIFVA